MPGVLGGALGAFSAAFSNSAFGEHKAEQFNAFNAMAPVDQGGLGRTAGEQGSYQFAALMVTLGISIGSGCLAGFLCGSCGKIGDGVKGSSHPCRIDQIHDDDEHWVHLAEDKAKIGVEALMVAIESKKKEKRQDKKGNKG